MSSRLSPTRRGDLYLPVGEIEFLFQLDLLVRGNHLPKELEQIDVSTIDLTLSFRLKVRPFK